MPEIIDVPVESVEGLSAGALAQEDAPSLPLWATAKMEEYGGEEGLELRARAVLAREDFGEYVRLALSWEKIKWQWHGIHELMVQMIAHCEAASMHCVIAAPPGIGKTSIVRLYAPWRLGRDPGLSVGFVSFAEAKASENLIHCRSVLMSGLTNFMWPGMQPSFKGKRGEGGGWSQTRLYLAGQNTPAAEAVTVLSDFAGRRYNILIFDDCITQTCLREEPTLAKVHDAIHGTCLPRLPPEGGFALFLNNCWHRGDTIHDFKLRADEHQASVLWVGYDWEASRIHWELFNPPPSWGEKGFGVEGDLPLWEMQPRKVLLQRRANAPTYKRLYMQMATVADESWLPHPTAWKEYAPKDLPTVKTGGKWIAYLDVSGGKDVKKGDYAAMVAGMKGSDGTLYVTDVFCKRCDPREQVRSLWNIHRAAINLGFQGLNMAEIEIMAKDEAWVTVKEWIEEFKQVESHLARMPWRWDYANRLAQKETRIASLYEPLFSGDIKFPAGFYNQARGTYRGEDRWSAEKRASWEIFLNQMEDFGSKLLDHDDGPDALSGLKRLADKTYAGQVRVDDSPGAQMTEHWRQAGMLRDREEKEGLLDKPKPRGINGQPLVKQGNVSRAWRI